MNNKKQRNRLFTMLLLVMVILMPYGGAWAQTPPSKGDGSADKPYKISTAAELAWFRDQVNSGNNRVSATLTEDIDLAEFCHAADGTTYTDELSWTPITWFQGTFDGNGKTISNLYINATSNYTGFFGYAYVGSIKNITFDNARVKNTGGYNFGILVGNAGSCIIENIKTLANCSVEGENYVGGIAGVANGNISNCENRATVKGIRYLGGVVAAYSGNSITSCANYGVVTGSGESVGGIAGYFNSGTIQNSANYGDVTGTDNVGNLIGLAEECNLNNVLGTGNVTATSAKLAGLLVGNIRKSSSTASGILAYNSSAKLTINGTEQTGDAVKAIGGGSLTSAEKIMAFTEEQLKSGLVANQLQKNVSGSARWGQKLNTNDYPLLGSADEVYLDGNLTMNCLGELEGTGTFTNTKPAQEGTFTFKHGDSPKHHKFVAATCTTDGNIEYWECNLCHKSFSNEQMTQMVSSLVVVSATGHEYDENDKCTKCQQEIPFLKLGNNSITIGKVFGDRNEISGYNLYKYTAPEDGTLEVTANSNRKNTYGTLWESRTAASCLTSDNSGNFPDFKITYTVTKGTTYYIGAREFFGKAIEGEVKLNVKMNGLDRELPAGMTGKGTEAEPFVLKTADHLAWFRDCVNECNTLVCAKIADEVKEIDMSTVCHKADTEKQIAELSWTPIGNFDNKYQGTFDGNGKTISNLYINATSAYAGFFGHLAGGNIKNITFDNAKVNSTGNYYTGILAGYAGSCIFENIKTLGNCSVEGKDITGGIAGIAVGNISNCENHAEVKGTKSLGGILGMYYGSDNSITSCANYGAVTGTYSQVGGMVGYFDSGTIQNSANYGDITGKDNVGNLIGEGIICNLNNVLGTGNVTATSDTERAGLLVGRISKSSSAASGILAYNSSAKLTINGAEQTGEAVKAIGEGSLTYPEGVNEADVIKAFTAEQLKSGEVAYLLAEGKVLGEQAWGQQLGKDQYPVPGSDYKVIRAAQGDKDTNGNDTYWATFSNPTNDVTLSVPSDRSLNVYNATVSGGKLTLTQRDKQVAKEEGVLLKTDGAYVNAKANETNDLTKVSSDVNHLVATPAEAKTVTAETGCKLYRLTYNKATAKERLGFYLSNDGISLKATPGKAYLQVSENEAKDPSSAALARSFVFGGGNETTGIDGITIMGTDVQRHGTIEGIFDLQGRKIVNPTKGIYIKNNKKVVIK
ncbi:hypothetical protein [Segatella copri]|uniref:hypothetical protein n=1 Tax=Segatella copri TaxID=165179 RepID=UPI0012916CAB|nr:hypothetical protein [Segatella copri]MQM95861.1 hypothetical protein [Segatella copri]MQN03526.1 hypothetical protein [Segatella copri]MQO39032.1 hypothetical protein [Segatella copri]